MAQRMRASTLSLKLDVIVEEDNSDTLHSFEIPNLDTHNHINVGESNATCTVTIRNVSPANSNDPQFLHSGKWPRMDLVDIVVEDESDTTYDNHFTVMNTADEVINDKSIGNIVSEIPSDTDTWGLINADQLSMAMDFWDPEENDYSSVSSISNKLSPSRPAYYSVHAAQQSLFVREIMDEHLTRVQTVEHIEELEDNDSAVEIVATLEGYRQSGWANEMIKAFPKECWLFWSNSGLCSNTEQVHDHSCDQYGYPLSRQ